MCGLSNQLLLTHVPGATPAFVKFKPSAEDKARIEAALDDEGSEQAQGQQGAGGGLHDCKATSPTVTDEWCENICSLGATARQDSAATARVCPLVASEGIADVVGIESAYHVMPRPRARIQHTPPCTWPPRSPHLHLGHSHAHTVWGG